jgi:hypothetical protein
MSDDVRVEVEKCLGIELREEFDGQGRLIRAETDTALLTVDPELPSGRFSSQFGISVWQSGQAESDGSYGTWEQTSTESISLQGWTGRCLSAMRASVVKAGADELLGSLRSWMSYVLEHDISVGRPAQRLVQLYASVIPLDRPNDLIEFARTVDPNRTPEVWAALLDRIEAFSSTDQRRIRTALDLGKQGRSGAKAPSETGRKKKA